MTFNLASVRIRLGFAMLGVLSISCCASGADLGLSVKDGVLLLEGKPYRGVGVNYFDLFYRILKNPDDVSTLANLDRLSKAGIPFVRFMACGFWPADRLYLDNEDEFFRRFDLVVRAAEKAHIGLVPSLFWRMATVTDLFQEHLGALGKSDSKAVDFIRRYSLKVIDRYCNSPAIWAWEFGNEYNLDVDLPEPLKHLPDAHPNLGTLLERDERDILTFEDVRVAENAFCHTVRAQDPFGRVIFSGNSMPRPSAYHNTHEHTWKSDSSAEFSEMLKRDNSAGFDSITVHAYFSEKNTYAGSAVDLLGLIAQTQKTAEQEKKPLFIGEFGTSRKMDNKQARNDFEEILNAIIADGVPIAAFWVFDHSKSDDKFNVEFDDDRSYQIELVGEANNKIKASVEKPH